MDENIIVNKEEISLEKKGDNGQNKQIAGAIIIAGLLIAGAILLKGNSEGKKLITNAKVFNACLDSSKYAQAVADSKTEASQAGVQGTPKGFILRDGKVVSTIDGAEPTDMVKQKIDDALAGKGKANDNMKLTPVTNNDFVLGGGVNTKVTVIEYADFQCPFCGKFFKETEETLLNSYIESGQISFVYRDFAFLGPESTRASEAARCAAEQGKFWEYHDYLFNHQKGENQGAFSDLYLKSFAGELKLK